VLQHAQTLPRRTAIVNGARNLCAAMLCHRSAVPNLGSILGRAAAWPASYLHRLPDSAFLHVETGGRIDPSGRTLPRSLRHLPIRDADGALDLPHLRDAMAQLPHAGPWLPPEVRDTLIAKAKSLHSTALTTTHKAAKGLPDWSLGYLAHIDRHEALGVPREEAHAAWTGDKMIAGRAVDLLKGLRRGGSQVAKAAGETASVVASLRKKVATFNAKVGDRPGMKQSLRSLAKAYGRGTAAFDATRRPVAKSRTQWGSQRVNAMLRLTASGKPDHPAYTGDHDLLPAGHPRATTKATPPAKPSTVVRPKLAAPAPPPPPVAPAPPKSKTAKPPKGKAPLPVKVKPAEAEKSVDTSALGEDVERTGGSPWPDADMAWLAAENVIAQLDTASSYARRDAELPTDASGDVGPVDWIPLTSPVAKDEIGSADLNASGKLAPDQGFDETTYQGIPIVVDRPKGTVQTGVGAGGQEWSRTYQTDYGYVPATAGGDGEELDVFLGPNPEAPTAWVAVQNDDAGDFDELKVCLGFDSEADARACYVAHIPERFLSSLQPVPVALLQAMLGLEPVALAKAVGSPRVSFGISGGKVHVQWPPSAPAVIAAAAPESGDAVVPDAPASFTMSARRAKAFTSMRKAIAGPTYEGAKALPAELAKHPALTAEPTETYSNPSEVDGWLYVIDGADTPSKDPNWIAWVGVDGKALLWTARDKDGGIEGVPYEFRRDDLIHPDEQGRHQLRGLTSAAPSAKPAIKAEASEDQKNQARHAVGHLVRTKQIDDPNDLECADCGHKGSDKLHEYDHHKGYAGENATKVQAVCTTCHKDRDTKTTKGARARDRLTLSPLTLDPDEMERHVKAARAIQSMLPAGNSYSVGKLPVEGETEKGMDGGCMLYSPTDALLDDPAELAALLASFENPFLAEHPDTPRARLELAKAGKVFVHNDVPGSIFVANYGPPEGVDVLDPHPDAGDDEATTFKTTSQGPDGDEPLNSRPEGTVREPSPDADRGVAPGLTNGVVKAEDCTIELKASGDAARAIGAALGGIDGRMAKALRPEDYHFVAIGKDAAGAPAQRYVLGPVLIPVVTDLQGDSISAEEIEKSERAWMERYQNLGWQHSAEPSQIDEFRQGDEGGKVPLLSSDKVVLVESYILRSDTGFVMINGRKVLAGTWLMGLVYKDDALWNEVVTGKRTGFSIGGFARRVPVGGTHPARG
jgi:5-methylcytosine-specific restriction endonuclease McrA